MVAKKSKAAKKKQKKFSKKLERIYHAHNRDENL